MYVDLGTDATIAPTPAPGGNVLTRLEAQQELILRELSEAAKHREYATIFGVAGAIFAAIRLGIVALPELRKRSSARANPAPRRRGRRR